MTAPNRVRAAHRHRTSPVLDCDTFIRPIAHRGWHDRAAGRLENSAPAFRAAIEMGYGIECDLQAAADGTPMVFHDEKLDRLVAASGPLAAYSPARLFRFRYQGQDEKILSFAQFLELVGGRVPMLVEVKANSTGPHPGFLEKIARQARAYRGPIALMSFDRSIVAALGERAPAIPRGSIVGSHRLLTGLWAGRSRTRESAAASRLFGAVENISFYAVDVKLVAVARTWMSRKALDLPLFTWTVRTPRQRAAAARWADAPIFEGYEA